jgi:hypothetical protein
MTFYSYFGRIGLRGRFELMQYRSYLRAHIVDDAILRAART